MRILFCIPLFKAFLFILRIFIYETDIVLPVVHTHKGVYQNFRVSRTIIGIEKYLRF